MRLNTPNSPKSKDVPDYKNSSNGSTITVTNKSCQQVFHNLSLRVLPMVDSASLYGGMFLNRKTGTPAQHSHGQVGAAGKTSMRIDPVYRVAVKTMHHGLSSNFSERPECSF